jgi:quinol monooxygenase YgiN
LTVAADRTTIMTVTEQEGTHDPDQHQDADPAREDGRVAGAGRLVCQGRQLRGRLLVLPVRPEFVCIEGFTDAEAGATHVKQPYVKKFFDTAPGLVATQPQIIYIDTPHDGFGPMGEIQPR